MSDAAPEADRVERRPFSWRRAALHGLVPVGFAVVAGAILAGLGRVADPERFGRGLGQLALFLWLTGFGVSWLAQTGRRTAAWVAGVFVGVGLAALVVVAVTGGPRGRPEPLTPAERAPLTRSTGASGAELSHPVVDFALRDPGPQFRPLDGPIAAQISEQLSSQPDQQAYGYMAGAGQALVVLLAKGVSEREDLEGLAQTLRDGFLGQLQGTVLSDEIIWTDDRHEGWFEGEIPGHGFVALRTLARVPGPDEALFGVSALAITQQRGTLDDVLQSLRIR